jgi:hypothetical protein
VSVLIVETDMEVEASASWGDCETNICSTAASSVEVSLEEPPEEGAGFLVVEDAFLEEPLDCLVTTAS